MVRVCIVLPTAQNQSNWPYIITIKYNMILSVQMMVILQYCYIFRDLMITASAYVDK